MAAAFMAWESGKAAFMTLPISNERIYVSYDNWGKSAAYNVRFARLVDRQT